MLGLVVGYVEGLQREKPGEVVPAALGVAAVVGVMTLVGMVSPWQVVDNLAASLMSNLSMLGAVVGNPFAGHGAVSVVMTSVLGAVYGFVDTYIGYVVYDIVAEVQKAV